MTTLLFKDDTFELSYTMHNGFPFLHCEVYKWTPRNFKKGLIHFVRELDKLLEEYGVVFSASSNGKFSELAGAKRVTKEIIDGKEIEVLKWE